jgi:hypothetical protein
MPSWWQNFFWTTGPWALQFRVGLFKTASWHWPFKDGGLLLSPKSECKQILAIVRLYWNPITLVLIWKVLRQAFRWYYYFLNPSTSGRVISHFVFFKKLYKFVRLAVNAMQVSNYDCFEQLSPEYSKMSVGQIPLLVSVCRFHGPPINCAVTVCLIMAG